MGRRGRLIRFCFQEVSFISLPSKRKQGTTQKIRPFFLHSTCPPIRQASPVNCGTASTQVNSSKTTIRSSVGQLKTTTTIRGRRHDSWPCTATLDGGKIKWTSVVTPYGYGRTPSRGQFTAEPKWHQTVHENDSGVNYFILLFLVATRGDNLDDVTAPVSSPSSEQEQSRQRLPIEMRAPRKFACQRKRAPPRLFF